LARMKNPFPSWLGGTGTTVFCFGARRGPPAVSEVKGGARRCLPPLLPFAGKQPEKKPSFEPSPRPGFAPHLYFFFPPPPPLSIWAPKNGLGPGPPPPPNAQKQTPPPPPPQKSPRPGNPGFPPPAPEHPAQQKHQKRGCVDLWGGPLWEQPPPHRCPPPFLGSPCRFISAGTRKTKKFFPPPPPPPRNRKSPPRSPRPTPRAPQRTGPPPPPEK